MEKPSHDAACTGPGPDQLPSVQARGAPAAGHRHACALSPMRLRAPFASSQQPFPNLGAAHRLHDSLYPGQCTPDHEDHGAGNGEPFHHSFGRGLFHRRRRLAAGAGHIHCQRTGPRAEDAQPALSSAHPALPWPPAYAAPLPPAQGYGTDRALVDGGCLRHRHSHGAGADGHAHQH